MRDRDDLPEPAGPLADGDSPLPAIDAAAAVIHEQYAQMLRLTIHAHNWGGTQQTAGWTVHDYLVHEAGLPGWFAGQLESVARRIDAVPYVADLFWSGVLSFDQLAGFVRATSSYNGELLARLDEEAASLAEVLAIEGRLHAFRVQVDCLVEELKAPGWRDRQERRLERGERIIVQQDFDGGGLMFRHLGPVAMPKALSAIDVELDPEEVRELGIQRARAKAAERIDEQVLSGDLATGLPARPTVVWHVDVAVATTDRFGEALRVAAGGDDGRLVPISKRLLTTLAEQADHVIHLRDGLRPLDELAVATDDIPAKTRRMVLARDKGCRFPGCRRRAVQVHHVIPRSDGGDHSPDNLFAACSLHHLRYIHKLGWHVALDPETGLVTWTNTRSGTTLSTKPHGHRPNPVRDPALLPDWLAPPLSPPPVHLDPHVPDDHLIPV